MTDGTDKRRLISQIADQMAVCEARRNIPRNKGRSLDDATIQHRVSSALERLKRKCTVDGFLFVFGDGVTKMKSFKFNGREYCLYFERGTRRYGATKIMRKHLIDGGTASMGGFTLEELNRDVGAIFSEGKITPSGNNLTISLKSSSGIEWKIVAFYNGRKWILNSLYTNRDQASTRKLVAQTRDAQQAKKPGNN